LAPLSIRTCTFMLWKTQFICSRQDIAFWNTEPLNNVQIGCLSLGNPDLS
jgi:hypothetical protein